MTILTAPLIDRDLTAYERPSSMSVSITGSAIRVTRGGDTRVTRGGNARVTRGAYTASPIVLTAQLIDLELTAQERR